MNAKFVLNVVVRLVAYPLLGWATYGVWCFAGDYRRVAVSPSLSGWANLIGALLILPIGIDVVRMLLHRKMR